MAKVLDTTLQSLVSNHFVNGSEDCWSTFSEDWGDIEAILGMLPLLN